MKKIIAIAWKDTRLRFSGLAEWLFFIILPVVFTVILAGGTGVTDDARIRLVVVDQAGTPLSKALVVALNRSEVVRPDMLPADQADDEFNQQRVSAVLAIPAGFDIQRLQNGRIELVMRQQPNNMNALVAYRAVLAVAGRLGRAVEIARSSAAEAERIRPFDSGTARQSYFDASLAEAQTLIDQAPDRIDVIQGATPDPVAYDPRANSSAGQLVTWVFIPLIGISGMFAYERQKGTLRRLLTTPTQKVTYLLGTIAGQLAVALVQMALLVVFGILVMRVNWGQSPVALAVMLAASVLTAAALGTALGAFVKTEGQANGLSMMLGMAMALLGGCWYPIELFPEFVRLAAHVLPTTWAMQGMLDLILRGQDVAGILPEAGVLLGFAGVFFIVGIRRFRYE